MNILIDTRPRFTFIVKKTVVDDLIILSKSHYDMKCRQASMVADASKNILNGFLTIWQFYAVDSGAAYKVYDAPWNDLDTVMKICEMRRAGGQDKLFSLKDIDKFLFDINQAIKLYQEKSKIWQVEYKS